MCAMDIDRIQRIDHAMELQWPQKYYWKAIKSKNYYAYFAQTNNQCVGSIMFRINNKELHIDKIVVTKRFQRQGIGGKLLKNALHVGIIKNVDAAILSVAHSNYSAIDFYFKHGFNIKFIQWQYYSNQDHGLKMYRNIQTVTMNK